MSRRREVEDDVSKLQIKLMADHKLYIKTFIIMNVLLLALLAAFYMAGMPMGILADTATPMLLVPNLFAWCIHSYRRDPGNANKKILMGMCLVGLAAIRFVTETCSIGQMPFYQFADSILLLAFGIYRFVSGAREKRRTESSGK